MTLQVDALPLGAIGTNCYVVRNDDAGAGFVVDPGDEPRRVLDLLAERSIDLEAILVTHCHWDHVGAVAAVAAATGAPVWMSETEAIALEQPEQFAFPGTPDIAACAVDHRLAGGEVITVAGIELRVLSVPGHSPGHLAFVASAPGGDERALCFIGDVVFEGSVGRTDLPFADPETLRQTLRHLVAELPPETVLLPGHGRPTTMRRELDSNPFLRGLEPLVDH